MAVIIGLFLAFQERGYKRGVEDGKKEGYLLGRIDADNWWLSAGQQADQARQKLWRQEGEKKFEERP